MHLKQEHCALVLVLVHKELAVVAIVPSDDLETSDAVEYAGLLSHLQNTTQGQHKELPL